MQISVSCDTSESRGRGTGRGRPSDGPTAPRARALTQVGGVPPTLVVVEPQVWMALGAPKLMASPNISQQRLGGPEGSYS